MTQAGYVRIVSNPAFSRDYVAPMQALAVLRQNTNSKDHQFWGDEINLPEALRIFEGRLLGHQQVTDAYLLALVIRKGGVLATFDAGVASLLELESPYSRSLEVLRVDD